MVGQGVPLEGEQNEIAPTIVVERKGIQNHGHKGTKVLDTRRLRVKVGDEGGLIVRVFNSTSIQNLRALVPVVMDPLSPHYNRWRDLVLLALERYALTDHVLSDICLAMPSWRRMNVVVLSWVLATLPELMSLLAPLVALHAAPAWPSRSNSSVIAKLAHFASTPSSVFSCRAISPSVIIVAR